MEEIDITTLKKYSDKEIISRSLKLIYPIRKQYFLGMLFMLLGVIVSLALPYVMGYYTDILDKKYLLSSGEKVIYTIIIVAISYFILVISNMIFTYLTTITLQKAGQKLIFKIRQQVFEKIETFSHEQLNKIPVGRLVTRVNNDTNSLNELYSTILVNIIKYALMIIGTIFMFVFINPVLFTITFAIMVLIITTTIFYRKYAKKMFSEERRQVSNLNTFLSENLNGIKVTQIFNQEKRKLKEFEDNNKALLKAKFNVVYLFALYRPIISFLYFLAIALVFLVGFNLANKGAVYFGIAFSFGRLVSYYHYTVNFFGPIQNIAEQLDKLQSGIVASERIFNILDMESTVKDRENPLKIDSFKGKIEFKNVYFAYQGEDWILKDVSFVVEPGQTVAFVGATGAGKTTILSLISRNYDIQKGQILIDDIDIKDIEISSLRKNIGQMLQDVFLFSGSIKDNITLRDKSISNEEIFKAIEYVNADSFISKLEYGLDTEVAEKGNNFSAGQRQLISFARTVVNKPQILILDEATSNIDTETEVLIQDSLNKMKNIGTMLVVAHRLSTIQHADNIICLANGEIVEQGNHQALLKKKSYYYKLYKLQFENKFEN